MQFCLVQRIKQSDFKLNQHLGKLLFSFYFNKINVKTSLKQHTKYNHGNGKSVHNGNLTVWLQYITFLRRGAYLLM